jgi:hypothetical protein
VKVTAAAKKRQERYAALFWLAVGIVVAVHAFRLGLGHLHTPGPGFIFFLAAGLLIVLSAIHIGRTFAWSPGPEDAEKEARPWAGVRYGKILLVVCSVCAYIFVFNIAGFFLSTFFLMLLMFKAVEPTRWHVAILSSLLTTGAAFAVFKVWLGVPFPAGFLGF